MRQRNGEFRVKIAAAVLTRNQFEHERRDLFDQTIDSLQVAGVDELFVIDNGSTDGTAARVCQVVNTTTYLSSEPNTTSGFGTWLCCRIVMGWEPDICIVSDDDIVWQPDCLERLTDWWVHAPNELGLTGGHLEPEFPWNAVERIAQYGGARGLIRQSTGAASWTFPHDRYDNLARAALRLPNRRQGVWDVPMCERLRQLGLQIGQLDLAEHIGQGRSSWGNGTESMYGWDVESVRGLLRPSYQEWTAEETAETGTPPAMGRTLTQAEIDRS